MTGDGPPSDSEVAEWVGEEAFTYWRQVQELIEYMYPDVFTAEWLNGGKKHGWSLRYKRSKPLCTLIPETDRFALLIVFGAQERSKVEGIRGNLSGEILRQYDAAITYHDGKWVLLTIDSDEAVRDAACLWTTKRKPRNNA